MPKFICLLTWGWEHVNKIYSLSMAAQNCRNSSDADEVHLAIALVFNSVWNVVILLHLQYTSNSFVLTFQGQKPKETLGSLCWGLVVALKERCQFLAQIIPFSLCLASVWYDTFKICSVVAVVVVWTWKRICLLEDRSVFLLDGLMEKH